MHESAKITQSDNEMISNRNKIFEMLQTINFSNEEKERLLTMFIRSSKLARIFGIFEIYNKISNVPGSILDIGTWRGETMVICENLRAILEPFNKQRRIFGFDTFEGYKGFKENETKSDLHNEGTYNVEKGYEKLLQELIGYHEGNNVMGHLKIHKVIKGDIRKTLPDFMLKNDNEIIALAFFDLNNYEPTSSSFKEVYKRLVKGGIVGFWQLTRDPEIVSAEGKFYNDYISKLPFTIRKSNYYPSLSYIIKE